MLKVAVTGGIGSGKTTVCKYFYNLGIGIFDSDYYAKQQYQIPEVMSKVIDLFGEEVFKDSKLNIKYLSESCFNDKSKLSELVNIVTPGVMKDYYDFEIKSTTPYTIFESAILFDYGLHKNFDFIIGVVTDKDERIKRVMKRSNKDKKEILKIMINQKNDDYIIKNSNFVVYNNSEDLERQVINIHNYILEKYEKI
ncbi:MAG: dephospho-CoA kinase [bacterium]